MSVTTETFPVFAAVGERHRTNDHPVAAALLDEFVRHCGIFVHVVQKERYDDPPEEERRALHEFLARTDAGGIEPDQFANAVPLHPGDKVPGDVGAESSPLVRASAEGTQHHVLSGEDLLQVGRIRRFALHDGEARVRPLASKTRCAPGRLLRDSRSINHRARAAQLHHSHRGKVSSSVGLTFCCRGDCAV